MERNLIINYADVVKNEGPQHAPTRMPARCIAEFCKSQTPEELAEIMQPIL